MAHARKQIRDAAASLLTGLTTTGSNVFENRVYEVAEDELPCLLIYTTNETIEAETIGPVRKLGREVELIVEGMAQANDDIDDILDKIGSEVETVIGGNRTLSDTAKEATLTSVESGLTSEGNKPAGNIRMTYTVYYRTDENAPDTFA